MRLIFEFVYSLLDTYFHREKIKRYLLKLDLNCNVILDIGSHRGESISFFNKLYKKSKIFGFEPQKICFQHLKQKFKSKRNIILTNCAIGKKKK